MIENLLLTGKPGVGKTTLIREVIQSLLPEGSLTRDRVRGEGEAGGFFTREIRERGREVGFEIETLSGEKGIVFPSPSVGRIGLLERQKRAYKASHK